MIVNSAFPMPFSTKVRVLESPWIRRSTWDGLPLPCGGVNTIWTLLAAPSAPAASCGTSAADFFSRPLVGVPVAVVAPPQALAVMVISAAIAVAAVEAEARRMRFIDHPLAGVPRARVTTTGCAGNRPGNKGSFPRARQSFMYELESLLASTKMMKFRAGGQGRIALPTFRLREIARAHGANRPQRHDDLPGGESCAPVKRSLRPGRAGVVTPEKVPGQTGQTQPRPADRPCCPDVTARCVANGTLMAR